MDMRLGLFICIVLSLILTSNGQDALKPISSTHLSFEIRGVMQVQVAVGDDRKKLQMIFDTGSSNHVIAPAYIKYLGNFVGSGNVETATRKIKLEGYGSPKFYWDKNPIHSSRPTAVSDLGIASEAAGWQVDGLFSPAELMGSKVLQIDFERNQIHCDPISVGKQDSVPLMQDKFGRPVIEITEFQEQMFLVDTGFNSAVMVKSDVFDRFLAQRKISKVRTIEYTSVDEHKVNRSGILDSISLGRHKFQNVPISEGRGNKIGLAVLMRFHLAFDLKNHHLFLIPNRNFSDEFEMERSGLALIWKDGKVVVTLVELESPGFNARIRNGDTLIRLNGIECTGENFWELQDQLTMPKGSIVHATISRENKSHEVTFTLLDYEDWGVIPSNP